MIIIMSFKDEILPTPASRKMINLLNSGWPTFLAYKLYHYVWHSTELLPKIS